MILQIYTQNIYSISVCGILTGTYSILVSGVTPEQIPMLNTQILPGTYSILVSGVTPGDTQYWHVEIFSGGTARYPGHYPWDNMGLL